MSRLLYALWFSSPSYISYTSQAQLLNAPASPRMPSMTDFGISEATLSRLTDYKEIFVDHLNPLTLPRFVDIAYLLMAV